MHISDIPGKIATLWASASGALRNTIPETTTTEGRASLSMGFPPETMQQIIAGGVPPYGQDMNGIIHLLTQMLRWDNAGGLYPFDNLFAASISGYPLGSQVMRSDGLGTWISVINNNQNNPESSGIGWVPGHTFGIEEVTLAGGSYTLAPPQYGNRIIRFSGSMTSNSAVIFPDISGWWIIINETTGSYSVTCKTPSGTGVAIPQGGRQVIYIQGGGVKPLWATEPEGDSTAKLATTAFVARAIMSFLSRSDFGGLHAQNGWFSLPGEDPSRPFIVQFITGAWDPADNSEPVQTVTLPVAFPHACYVRIPGCELESQSDTTDHYYQTFGTITGSVSFQRQRPGTGSYTVRTRPSAILIGD